MSGAKLKSLVMLVWGVGVVCVGGFLFVWGFFLKKSHLFWHYIHAAKNQAAALGKNVGVFIVFVIFYIKYFIL